MPINFIYSRVSQVMLKVVGRAFFFCVGIIQIKVKGKRAEATEAPILVVAPHSTFFDAVVNIVADIPSIVSRAENADVPLIGCKFYLSLLLLHCFHCIKLLFIFGVSMVKWGINVQHYKYIEMVMKQIKTNEKM